MKITQKLISLLLTLSMFWGISAGAWADTLTLPRSIRVIEEEAFAGNTALDEVVIPEGLESIGPRAFADSSVKSVELPASVTDIAEDAFWSSSPAVTAIKDSYAWRWAAARGMITTFAFSDESAYDFSMERAIFEDNPEIGLYHADWIRNYQIANYDLLAERYGGEPQWSLETVGDSCGAELRIAVGEWAGEGSRAVDLMISNEPTYPCTLQYRITCTWGGETITGDGSLVYREADLPTGMAAQAEYYGLKAGEPYALKPAMLPSGYFYTEPAYCDIWTDMSCESWEEWQDGECTRFVRPLEAGTYSAWLVLQCSNVQLRKMIVLYVEDENGYVPPAMPKLEQEYSFDIALAVENNPGCDVYLSSNTLGISVQNEELLRAFYGDDYSWSFRTVEGTPVELFWNPRNGYFDFTVNNLDQMTAGTQSLVEATLNWGYSSAVTTFCFRFGVLTLPDEIRFDENIRMTAGETYRAEVSVSPEASSLRYFLWYDLQDESSMEKWQVDDRNAFFLRAHEPGYYLARPHIHTWDNAFVYGNWFPIYVYDTQGNIPDPVPYFLVEGERFETDFMLGEFASPEGEGWFSDYIVFGWVLDNLPQLYEAYGEDPEIVWGYTYTDGLKLSLELEPWQSERYVGDGCDVLIREMPDRAGYMDFILYCEWNGHHGELPCRIYINEKPANLPQTNTFPDEITVGIGETVYVSGHYSDDVYDISEHYYWIDTDSNYAEIDRNPNEKGSIAVTGLQEGTITALAKVGVSRNAYVQKPVTIRIEDKKSQGMEALESEWSFYLSDDALNGISLNDIEDQAEREEVSGRIQNLRDAIAEYNSQVDVLASYLTEVFDMVSIDNENGYSFAAPELSYTISTDVIDLLSTADEIGKILNVGDEKAQLEVIRDGETYTVEISGDGMSLVLSQSAAVADGPAASAEESPVLRSSDETDSFFGDVEQKWDSLEDSGVNLGEMFNTLQSLLEKTDAALTSLKEYKKYDLGGLDECVGLISEVVDFLAIPQKCNAAGEAHRLLGVLKDIKSHLHPTAEEQKFTLSVEIADILNSKMNAAIWALRSEYFNNLFGAFQAARAITSRFYKGGASGGIQVKEAGFKNFTMGMSIYLDKMNQKCRGMIDDIVNYHRQLHYDVNCVVKDESGKGLYAVKVTCENVPFYTDPDGQCTIEVPYAPAVLTFEKPGYTKKTEEAHVTAFSPLLLPVTLEKDESAIVVSGKVVNNITKKPMRDVKVSAAGTTAYTDENGEYSFSCHAEGSLPIEFRLNHTKGADFVLALDGRREYSVDAKLEYSFDFNSIVSLGRYEQDNDASNGKERIKWFVMHYFPEENKAYVVSLYALDSQPYHTKNPESEERTWADSSLRGWLNGSFMNAAFTAQEKQAILTANVDNSIDTSNYWWEASPVTLGYNNVFTQGSNTTDKIFLISYRDSRYYDMYDHLPTCSATEYAKAQGAAAYRTSTDPNNSSTYSPYWLRTPVHYTYYDVYEQVEKTFNYAMVSFFNTHGVRKVETEDEIAVRPAMYIDLTDPTFLEECYAYLYD